MSSDITLFSRVRAKLRSAGIAFEEGKTLGGFQPDFIVKTGDGRLLILDLKPRHTTEIDRAVRQAERLREATGADGALVVVPDSEAKKQNLREGVVAANKLVEALTSGVPPSKARKTKAKERATKVKKKVFAAMPFDEKYDDVFFVAIAHAAKAVNATAYRVDKDEFAGDIVAKLKSEIAESIAVVADISEAKPNVLYEAGYAHAIGIPAIHICSTPLKKLPFDVSHWSTLEYKLGQIHAFRTRLARRLKELLKKRTAA